MLCTRFSWILLCLPFLAGDAALAALPDGFQDQMVVDVLDQPTDFAFLPDGRMLVTEKAAGRVRLVVNGVLSPAAVLTLHDLNTTGYEQGLLGIAVDPAWPTRPYVYLYFDRSPGNTIYVSRFKGSGDLNLGTSTNLTLKNRYDILTTIPDAQVEHNGGGLRFGPDGMLYASSGDDCDICAVQDSTQWEGKILRLMVSGLPDTGPNPPARSLITPPDNPFPAGNPQSALVFCEGLRNPFRFQIDSQTGHLFIGDVGADEFEELNESTGGENFGWPFREGNAVRTWSDCFEPGGAGSHTYTGPIFGYDRTAMPAAVIIAGPNYHAPSGGAYSFPSQYEGAVFYADYYDGFIRVVKKLGITWYPLFTQPGQPNLKDWATETTEIVQFERGPDGALYYLNLFPGSIHRIIFTGSPLGGVGDGGNSNLRLRAWPNPYRLQSGRLDIERSGGAGSRFTVLIISIEGRVIRELVSESKTRARWDGRDAEGILAPGGVYFLRVQGENNVSRVVLLP